MTPEQRAEQFWEPCQTREELQAHMRSFIKIDLPDDIVDEESNSSALDFVWEVYRCMLTGRGPTRHVVAASRNTAKTLSACVLRFYGMVHFRRDGTHLAANLDQSKSANKYLDRFLRIKDVAPYVRVNNSREKELANLPANQYTKRSESVLRIAVATPGGVNSQRGSLNIRDELDLIKAEILSEAAFQADPTQDEHQFPPIEINLSSRKTKTGPIQKLLDEADKGRKTTLRAHKWSLVDWMRHCPVETHLPDQPRQSAWINTETLAVTWDERVHDAMGPAEKNQQKQVDAFAGCRKCPAFIVCQSRAPEQSGNSRMLRDIEFVETVIDQVGSADKLIAQALNWKPESSSVVFKQFRRERHFLGFIEFYRWLTGQYYNPDQLSGDDLRARIASLDPADQLGITPTKRHLYDQLVLSGWTIHYGVDWGYSPATATCIVVAYHKRRRRAAVLHCAGAQEYANQDWADFISTEIFPSYPADFIVPDMEDPASPTYFAKHKIRCLAVKPPRIETGVSQIRTLLWRAATQSSSFAILDDGPGGQNERLVTAMTDWTHKKTPVGFDYSRFEDDDNCDWIDPTRYALNPFLEEAETHISTAQPKAEVSLPEAAGRGDVEAIQILKEKNEMMSQMREYFSKEHGLDNVFPKKEPEKPKTDRPKGGSGIKFKF